MKKIKINLVSSTQPIATGSVRKETGNRVSNGVFSENECNGQRMVSIVEIIARKGCGRASGAL